MLDLDLVHLLVTQGAVGFLGGFGDLHVLGFLVLICHEDEFGGEDVREVSLGDQDIFKVLGVLEEVEVGEVIAEI